MKWHLAGTWTQTWIHKAEVQTKKVHQRQAFVLSKRELTWKRIFHYIPPSRHPLLFTLGRCSAIQFSFWLCCGDSGNKEGHENCLSGSIDFCKSTSECLSLSLSSRKKKKIPTQGKIVPELIALFYQDKILGTRCKNLSLTKRKFADVVDVWHLLNTENKAAQEEKVWNFLC